MKKINLNLTALLKLYSEIGISSIVFRIIIFSSTRATDEPLISWRVGKITFIRDQ